MIYKNETKTNQCGILITINVTYKQQRISIHKYVKRIRIRDQGHKCVT